MGRMRGRALSSRPRSIVDTNPFDSAYDDVRLFKVIGVEQVDSWDGTAVQAQSMYDTYMKTAYHNPPDNDVYFGIRPVIRWNTALVDDTVTPTLAQMRDHTWSGYAWNPAGSHRVDTMRNAQCFIDNKAKVLLQIAVSATSGDPVPNFMLTNGWAWTGSSSQERVKFYNSTARQYAANFVLACIDRFVGVGSGGNGIASIKLGEYFKGSVTPGDWTTQAAYDDGYWTFQQLIADGMSTASDGKRVLIHQSNPQQTATNTYDELIPRKMGMSASDPHLWNHTGDFYDRNDFHGIIPMAAPGDSPNYTQGDTTSWQVPPANPFGFTNNQVVDFDPIHAAWWYGKGGVVRMPLEWTVAIGGASGFQTAMDAFAPGGTLRNWNGSPQGVAYLG